MVDSVELIFGDQALEMRHLDGDDAFGRQEMRHAGDEIVELRHLRQHIVGHDQIGAVTFSHHLRRSFGAEKGVERRNAGLPRRLGNIGSRLDAEHRHAEADKMLQQIAVIAAELDNEAFRAKPEPAFDHFAIAAGMRHPGGRIG